MRYIETTTIRCSRTMLIAAFIQTNELVRQQAGAEGPLDWLAGQFLPDAGMKEGYQDWIARQVAQILEAALLHDAMRDGRHVARKVTGFELTADDRAWLFQALGHHPAVLAVWRTMAMDAIAA